MKTILLTCPFTGVEFEAMQDENGNLHVINPLTENIFYVLTANSCNDLILDKRLFTHVETATISETADILGVSRQRISAIVSNETIPVHTVNGQTVFLLSDVLEYKENRKPGAPRKA